MDKNKANKTKTSLPSIVQWGPLPLLPPEVPTRTWDEGTAPSPPVPSSPHKRNRGERQKQLLTAWPEPWSITVVPALHSFQFRAERGHWHEGQSPHPHCADEQTDGSSSVISEDMGSQDPETQLASLGWGWGGGMWWSLPLALEQVDGPVLLRGLWVWESPCHPCLCSEEMTRVWHNQRGRRKDGREGGNLRKRKMKGTLGTAWFLLDAPSSIKIVSNLLILRMKMCSWYLSSLKPCLGWEERGPLAGLDFNQGHQIQNLNLQQEIVRLWGITRESQAELKGGSIRLPSNLPLLRRRHFPKRLVNESIY